jgi:hypothetical protein
MILTPFIPTSSQLLFASKMLFGSIKPLKLTSSFEFKYLQRQDYMNIPISYNFLDIILRPVFCTNKSRRGGKQR